MRTSCTMKGAPGGSWRARPGLRVQAVGTHDVLRSKEAAASRPWMEGEPGWRGCSPHMSGLHTCGSQSRELDQPPGAQPPCRSLLLFTLSLHGSSSFVSGTEGFPESPSFAQPLSENSWTGVKPQGGRGVEVDMASVSSEGLASAVLARGSRLGQELTSTSVEPKKPEKVRLSPQRLNPRNLKSVKSSSESNWEKEDAGCLKRAGHVLR
ncbi:Proteasome Activator Complex Subunit 4 [Manis pentadactyla]|nr:Proteasome Activator Complex Subunit 4 [Manis pentadactyla]